MGFRESSVCRSRHLIHSSVVKFSSVKRWMHITTETSNKVFWFQGVILVMSPRLQSKTLCKGKRRKRCAPPKKDSVINSRSTSYLNSEGLLCVYYSHFSSSPFLPDVLVKFFWESSPCDAILRNPLSLPRLLLAILDKAIVPVLCILLLPMCSNLSIGLLFSKSSSMNSIHCLFMQHCFAI